MFSFRLFSNAFKPFKWHTIENGHNEEHKIAYLKTAKKGKNNAANLLTGCFPVILCQKQKHQISSGLFCVYQTNDDVGRRPKSIDVNDVQVDTTLTHRETAKVCANETHLHSFAIHLKSSSICWLVHWCGRRSKL